MIDDLTPEELELAALSTFRTVDAVRLARSAGVSELSFQTAELAGAWEYICSQADVNREASPGDIKVVCGVELTEGIDDTETLVAALVERSVRYRALQSIVARFDEGGDSLALVRGLAGDLAEITGGSTKVHSRSFEADAGDRLVRVEEAAGARERGEVVGIPTGLSSLDKQGDTWRPGDLVAIMGKPNVGKSWLLIKCAEYAYWHANASVLYLSPESMISDVESRLDVLVARELGITLSQRAIRRGTVDVDEYRRYIEALRAEDRGHWVTRDSGDAGVFTVSDIVTAAREYRPDILCIDGFHLIRGDGKSWEAMKAAAEQVIGLAHDMSMVVLATAQVQRQAVMAPNDVPTTGEAAYGMALMEASNRVIGLAEWRGHPKHRRFRVTKHRDGEVTTALRTLLFDVDSGDVREVDPDVDEDSGIVGFEGA